MSTSSPVVRERWNEMSVTYTICKKNSDKMVKIDYELTYRIPGSHRYKRSSYSAASTSL